jgi:hypothetical protein
MEDKADAYSSNLKMQLRRRDCGAKAYAETEREKNTDKSYEPD